MTPRSIPTLDDYMMTLGRQSEHPDPTEESPHGMLIKDAAAELALLGEITQESLAAWIKTRPLYIGVLGLSVGLSREKLLNNLTHGLGVSAPGNGAPSTMAMAKNK